MQGVFPRSRDPVLCLHIGRPPACSVLRLHGAGEANKDGAKGADASQPGPWRIGCWPRFGRFCSLKWRNLYNIFTVICGWICTVCISKFGLMRRINKWIIVDHDRDGRSWSENGFPKSKLPGKQLEYGRLQMFDLHAYFFGFQKATRNFTKSKVESDIARSQVSDFDAPSQCFFLGCNDQIYIVDCERSIIPCLSPSPRDSDQTCNELKLVLWFGICYGVCLLSTLIRRRPVLEDLLNKSHNSTVRDPFLKTSH